MTTLLLYIALLLSLETLVVLVLWWAHLRFWGGRLQLPLDYAATEELVMPDGGTIELRRIGASSTVGARGGASRVPVLLIHGLAMNHRNHDGSEDGSFARYLRDQGRDVWLLTLRSGRSSRSFRGHPRSDFAAMVKYDVPSAVDAVLDRTGQPQLDLGGFSMGGMLLYATLDRTLDPSLVRRVATFAAPAKIRPLGVTGMFHWLPPSLTPAVRLRLFMRSFAFFPRLIPSLLWRRLYNPKNVEPTVERRMLWNVWEDIPGRLGSDFSRWAARGGDLTVDGVPVLPGLSHVSTPVCFFAGKVDWLAPAYTVRAGYEAWGRDVPGIDKHFVVLGRETGAVDDYGHCDLSFGRHVKREVFEPAARFLASGVFCLPQSSTVEPREPELASADSPLLAE
jgi:polyhydroxyalkanoate synthase